MPERKDPSTVAVAIRIKTARERACLTKEEVARKVGVARSTYYGYESGTRRPKSDQLAEMSRLFGVSADWLTGATDDPRTMAQIIGTTEPDDAFQTEEAEFRRWAKDSIDARFFHDFNASPDEAKAALMRDMRKVWREHQNRLGK